ncbi:alpha-D-ribose 1-methylphosphonate 5-triphosphate synthase subunit PhnH [Epibacterium ulvae]|uniref:Alpha-D-ribose 1-methylphosphonate 5-triphosphate synthase subunit PhnH n=1 Tax=Epibacterium ulvae TaxID=1156985 RepID=A0A1G5PMU1_9RHOB|nr:phosphonate C-P lyase system protein PhnH [Epibacterium ulvae]SCZ50389.1 alpha-D-ribose 1-methylphosphonate 5-triphosphate synthase subunit PhnH [Epibacterium ulvae]
MGAHVFSGGFADPAVDAARAFRTVMSVLARPGEVQNLAGGEPPQGLSCAAGTLLLTLCDPETGIFLAPDVDRAEVRDWLTFHTNAPFVSAEEADFAVGGWYELMPLTQYRTGTAEYPDQSATLIVESSVQGAKNAILQGPGINERAEMALPDIARFQHNATLYPQGLDFFFTYGSQIYALPRSTHVTPKG